MQANTLAASHRTSAIKVETFDAGDYVLGLLKRAVANGQNISIQLDASSELELLSVHGEYFSRIPDRKRFFTTAARAFKVRILSNDEADELRRNGRFGRNIDELMWLAAHYASAGRLLKECRPDDVIHLKHWPNLSRLPHTVTTMRLAALFSRYPTSLKVATMMLKVPETEVYQFYSAAFSSGLAVTVNRKPRPGPDTLAPHRDRMLLSRILKRIAGI